MKICSHCKHYKSEKCELKPETEYFIAEKLDCFDLDFHRAALAPSDPESMRWGWILHIGGILFWVGVTGFIIFLLILFLIVMFGVDDFTYGPLVVILFYVSIVMTISGAVLWFVYWMEKRGYWQFLKKRDDRTTRN